MSIPPDRKVQQYRLVLLGNTAVGKSSLVLRFVKDQFLQFQEPTIGASFLTQSVTIGEITVKFEIWDTAGQERYRSLAPMYYRGAQAAVVVYDVTCEDSFCMAKVWIAELRRHASENIVIALVGNKVDLATEMRAVESETADQYARGEGLHFQEASAKTAFNVAEIFLTLATELSQRSTKKSSLKPRGQIMSLNADDTAPVKRCC